MAASKKNMTMDAAPGPPAASSQPGDDCAEVAEERVEVVTYAAAIDVAKGFGMVCTRVPGSRPDRKRQAVWQVDATYRSVIALMDHLRCQGIQRLVLESTPVIRGINSSNWTSPWSRCRGRVRDGGICLAGSVVYWPGAVPCRCWLSRRRSMRFSPCAACRAACSSAICWR
jgi:hypothetical protein